MSQHTATACFLGGNSQGETARVVKRPAVDNFISFYDKIKGFHSSSCPQLACG